MLRTEATAELERKHKSAKKEFEKFKKAYEEANRSEEADFVLKNKAHKAHDAEVALMNSLSDQQGSNTRLHPQGKGGPKDLFA